ncbi:MAG TPA: hypothetical protein VGC34_00755 [Steroidobacteraceae bacterium]
MRAAVLNFLRIAGLDLTPLQGVPTPSDPRDELKRARRVTIEARRRHEEELAILHRLQSLGPAADAAEREAVEAEAAYASSIASWARGSADGSVGDGELARRAEAARSRATRARLAAKGADDALTARQDWDFEGRATGPRTTPNERDARSSLRTAESNEKHARQPVIAATIEPLLAEFEALMARARELDSDLQGFDAFATYNTGLGFGRFIERYSAARLFRVAPTNQEERARLRLPWMRFDNRLKADPDAEF